MMSRFNSDEERHKFYTENETGKKIVAGIQSSMTYLIEGIIKKDPLVKDMIDRHEKRGFYIDVGISIAVSVMKTNKEKQKPTFDKEDEEFLDSIGLSWEEE